MASHGPRQLNCFLLSVLTLNQYFRIYSRCFSFLSSPTFCQFLLQFFLNTPTNSDFPLQKFKILDVWASNAYFLQILYYFSEPGSFGFVFMGIDEDSVGQSHWSNFLILTTERNPSLTHNIYVTFPMQVDFSTHDLSQYIILGLLYSQFSITGSKIFPDFPFVGFQFSVKPLLSL